MSETKTIRFLETYTVDAVDGETYEKGKSYDVAPASAFHFTIRGLAEEVEKKTRKASSK